MTLVSRSRFLAFGMFLLCAPSLAFAQHEKGDKTLAGSGSIQFVKGADSGGGGGANGTITGRLGVFAGTNTEIGVLASINLSVGQGLDGGTDFTGLVGANLAQYFGSDRTRPYLGILGLTSIESGLDNRPFFFQGAAGIRHYLNRNGALFVELDYGMIFVGGESEFQDLPTLQFGFAVVF